MAHKLLHHTSFLRELAYIYYTRENGNKKSLEMLVAHFTGSWERTLYWQHLLWNIHKKMVMVVVRGVG